MTGGDPSLQRALGIRVRELRAEQELTQRALAELTGMQPSYIASVELGEKNPTLLSLAKLAHALGCRDVGELVAGISL